MHDSPHLGAPGKAAALFVASAVGVMGTVLVLGEGTNPATLGVQQTRPVVSAAAYRAVSDVEAGSEARVALWSAERGGARLTSAIAVANVSGMENDVRLDLYDAEGKELACTGCAATLAPGAATVFWPPELKGADTPGTVGEGVVFADGPVLVAVADVPLGAHFDHALYAAVPVGADLQSPVPPQHALVLNGAIIDGLEAKGDGQVHIINLDRQQSVTALASFFPWSGGVPAALRVPVDPGRSEVLRLMMMSAVQPGAYAAQVSAQTQIGVATRTEWSDRRAAAMGEAVWRDTDLALPAIAKRNAERCSIVAVHNTSAVSTTAATAELYADSGGAPLLQIPFGLPPGGSTALAPCADRRFDSVPDGFLGSMRIRSADNPLAAETLLDHVGGAGMAQYGAQASWQPAVRLHAPLIHAGWDYTGGAAPAARYESRIAVMNPTRGAVTVTVAFTGTRGACSGKTVSAVPQTVPGLGSTVIAPGPSGDAVLDAGCMAYGVIQAAGGPVFAVVLDEGTLQDVTPTPSTVPTQGPSATASPTATATVEGETPEPTEEPSPTATPEDVSPTPADGSPTLESPPPATGQATATFVPTRTPPPDAPRPPLSTVAPESWVRANRGNSLLPFDFVRFLHVDRAGNTWLRLINPRGGPDTIVTATRTGVWETFRGGLRPAVEALSQDRLQQLGAVRDFFDRDTRGRTWIGPEYYDGARWHVVSRDDTSAAGSVHYDGRALLDPGDRAWLPFRASGDCIPPQPCGNDGLRVFGPDGGLVDDVVLAQVPDAARYGVDRAQLVTARGARGAAGTLDARLSAPLASRAGFPAFQPAGSAQSGGSAAWAVTPDRYYRLPSLEPGYYPYLDPREFLTTGLRNSGYATAAALAPSGLLQVITWVEVDLGSAVEHRILLNSLHDSGWEVEDLTPSPLFGPDVEFERVVAMDYCSSGELWLATAAGAVGARRDGERPDGAWTVYPADSGLFDPGELPTDIACGEDGAVWIGSRGGLLGYGFSPPPVRIFAPYTARRGG